jgi:hypothetical protein
MIVGLVPTYREGPLAADAVRSLLPCCDAILVTEGHVGQPHEHGDPTDPTSFRKIPRVTWTNKPGGWANEAAKRNEMLQRTRRYPPPVWGVYVDADEVLINGELIPSIIWAAERRAEPGNDVVAIPLHITQVDGSVARIHRVIRLDRLDRHVLSMSQLQFIDQSTTAVFPNIALWRPGEPIGPENRPPLLGEPSLHHRDYLRPPKREDLRLHKLEVDEYVNDTRAELARLGFNAEDGGTPIHVDRPELIIATDTGKRDQHDPFGLTRQKGGNDA